MMQNADLVVFLNALLEAERAGAKAATIFRHDYADSNAAALIEQVRRDEAWCCGMLSGWITRLGGEPSQITGDFLQKVVAKHGLDARLRFLNRGQDWVVGKLREIIPALDAADLRKDLQHMLDLHVVNIDECAAFLTAQDSASEPGPEKP